jgi:hypothetical protein
LAKAILLKRSAWPPFMPDSASSIARRTYFSKICSLPARPATGALQSQIYIEIPLLIVDDLGMRKLPASAAEDLLEIVMRRYERTATILTSKRPLEDWAKLFGDTPAVAAFLDRLMHHSHLA